MLDLMNLNQSITTNIKDLLEPLTQQIKEITDFLNLRTKYMDPKPNLNPNLGGGGELTPLPPHRVGFLLITQKRKSCNPGILQHSHFIRDIRANFGIPNSSQSPDIGQNSDGGISDFRNSRQSLIKENRHNSRTSDDIDMKLGAVTKLD